MRSARPMRQRGIELALGRTVDAPRARRADGIAATLSDGSMLTVDQVLVATGRRPNTAGSASRRSGIAVDEVGAIPVDAYSQTLVPSIYAVGDVTNRANLTPVAIREGHAFADTVFGGKPTMRRPRPDPDRRVLDAGDRRRSAAARTRRGRSTARSTSTRPSFRP